MRIEGQGEALGWFTTQSTPATHSGTDLLIFGAQWEQ